MDYAVHVIEETMEKEYQTKVMKAEVKKVKKELPIFQKRNHWCFRHDEFYINLIPSLKQKQNT